MKEKLKYKTYIFKLYLYYHLYLREKYFINRESYSQNREDIFINKFFKKKIKGFYVDVGAYHPTKFSNTQLLYNKGWNGINIDMNPVSIDCFKIVRKRDKNILAAVSNKKIKSKVFINSYFLPTNSLDKKHFQKWNKDYKKDKFFKIKTKKFNDLVNNKIDFLNIDLEGYDYKVLKTINLKKYEPSLVCIEILKKKDESKFNRYFKKFKYKYIKKIMHSYFYKKH